MRRGGFFFAEKDDEHQEVMLALRDWKASVLLQMVSMKLQQR